MYVYIYIYIYIIQGRSLRVASIQGSLRFGFASRSVDQVSIRSRFGSGRFALSPMNAKGCLLLLLLTATAPLPFFFSESARSVCGAGASQASMSIYRAKPINDLLSTILQAYRALTHHLEPTFVSG